MRGSQGSTGFAPQLWPSLQMLPWAGALTYFSNLKKREDGRSSLLQKCVNPHSRAIILLNKIKLSSVIPVAQNMAFALCS